MSSLLIDAWRRDPKIWSCSSIISPFGKSSSVWRYKALIKALKLLLPVPIFPIVLDVLSTQLIPHKVKSPFCTLSPIFFMNIWLLKPDWWFRFSCGRNMLEVIATSPPQKPWLAVAPDIKVYTKRKGWTKKWTSCAANWVAAVERQRWWWCWRKQRSRRGFEGGGGRLVLN